MQITLENAGRRFNREWIFRHVDLTFQTGEKVVILGSNGSGKSTLLQLISGFLRPSEGTVIYDQNGPINEENAYQNIALASPYLEIFEDYTLTEAIAFHKNFKPLVGNHSVKEITSILQLEPHRNKAVKNFSSGMKQRLRLGLAILSDTPVLLLDEPTSNLDAAAILWYQQLVEKHAAERLVIVCSNHQKQEYEFCTREIVMDDLKQKLQA